MRQTSTSSSARPARRRAPSGAGTGPGLWPGRAPPGPYARRPALPRQPRRSPARGAPRHGGVARAAGCRTAIRGASRAPRCARGAGTPGARAGRKKMVALARAASSAHPVLSKRLEPDKRKHDEQCRSRKQLVVVDIVRILVVFFAVRVCWAYRQLVFTGAPLASWLINPPWTSWRPHAQNRTHRQQESQSLACRLPSPRPGQCHRGGAQDPHGRRASPCRGLLSWAMSHAQRPQGHAAAAPAFPYILSKTARQLFINSRDGQTSLL